MLCRHNHSTLGLLSLCLCCFSSCFLTPSPAAVGFVSEDEYLEIQGITREQSGDYECSASNDVAAPVVRRVKVTVNCEWSQAPPPSTFGRCCLPGHGESWATMPALTRGGKWCSLAAHFLLSRAPILSS